MSGSTSPAKFPLPSEEKPNSWDDDVRMCALFAPFRLKSVNPVDYESKMRFWSDLVSRWCKNRGSFTLEELKTAFQRKGKFPACLDVVIETMFASGSIQGREAVAQSGASWLSRGLRLATRPATWAAGLALAPLSSFIGNTAAPTPAKRYVKMDTIKERALQLLAAVPEDCRVGSIGELLASASCSYPEGDTLSLMLEWLHAQGLAVTSQDGQLYKLALPSSSRVIPFTEGELCLPKLARALKRLENSVEELESKAEEARLAAKAALQRQDKKAALGHLRQKKLLEVRVEKALCSQDSILLLMDSVRQSHSDADILHAYKSGLGALKSTMKNTGLEENLVLDTMDDLKETMDMYSDIETAISQPMGVTIDNQELEDELRDLIASDHSAPGGGGGHDESQISDLDEEANLEPGPATKNAPTAAKVLSQLPTVPPKSLNSEKTEDEEFHQKMEKRLRNLRLATDSS